jgi:hypothetical protein
LTLLSEFIGAVATLMWPIFAFWFVWFFRTEIRQILKRISRIKRGKILGQEIELEEDLDKLEHAAEKTQSEIAKIPAPEPPILRIESTAKIDQLLLETAKSPRASLMILGTQIERRVHQLLAATGWKKSEGDEPLPEAIERLKSFGVLPSNITGTLKLFVETRNKIIHGGSATDEDIFRAIDSGLLLLKAVDSVPAEVNIVYRTNIELYSDSTCTQKRNDVKGLILETISPGGATKSYRIVPTTLDHFQKGERVAWEWSFGKLWMETWYKNPDSGEIKQAWIQSAEFVGRHLNEIT